MPEVRPAALQCPNCGAPAAPESQRCDFCRSRLATISCPSCFRAMFVGAAYCSHCGSRASRVEEGQTGGRCPRCRDSLTRVALGGVTLAECAGCDGVWIDAEEFERLCTDREAQAAVLNRVSSDRPSAAAVTALQHSVRYRPCVRCRKLMNRLNFGRYSGVVIDICRGHGAFLDPGELHRLVSFIREGGLDRTRIREREELQEEQRRLRALQEMLRGEAG